MQFNLRRLTLCSALSLLTFPALAAVDHIGTPDPKPALIATFGVDAPAQSAIKAIVPMGWQVLIHPAAKLAPRASWSGDQAWVEAMATIARQSGLDVKFDWDKRLVFLRTPAIAAEERLAAMPAPEEKPEIRVSTLASVASLPAMSAVEVPPTVGSSKSFSNAKLSGVLEYVARIHNLTLSHSPTRDVSFPGAVSIKGVDVSEDLRLVTQALGSASMSSIEYYPQSRFVRVVPSKAGGAVLAVMDRPYEGLVTSKAPGFVEPVQATAPAPAPLVAQVAADAANAMKLEPAVAKTASAPIAQIPSAVEVKAEKSEPAAPSVMTLRIPKGSSLEKQINDFVKEQGYALHWTLNDSFEANWPLEASGTSITEVLLQVLPHLGLSADVVVPSKVVIVRVGDSARDR